jgi:hypothetical protein
MTILGTFVCIPLGYIIPSIFGFKLLKTKFKQKLMNYLLLIYGTIVFFISLISFIIDIKN